MAIGLSCAAYCVSSCDCLNVVRIEDTARSSRIGGVSVEESLGRTLDGCKSTEVLRRGAVLGGSARPAVRGMNRPDLNARNRRLYCRRQRFPPDTLLEPKLREING